MPFKTGGFAGKDPAEGWHYNTATNKPKDPEGFKSGDSNFKPHSDQPTTQFVPSSPWFNSLAALINGPLVCLQPDGDS